MKNKGKLCATADCDEPAYCKGLCEKCYSRKRYVPTKREPRAERMAKLCVTPDCGKPVGLGAKGLCAPCYSVAYRAIPEHHAAEQARNANASDDAKIQRKIYFAQKRTNKTGAGGSFTIDEWVSLCAENNDCCLCCGKQMTPMTLEPDHVISVPHFGSSDIENIQPLCGPCNKSKRNKHTDYRHMPMVAEQFVQEIAVSA